MARFFLFEPSNMREDMQEEIHEFDTREQVEQFMVDRLEEDDSLEFRGWVLIEGHELEFIGKVNKEIFVDISGQSN